MAERISKGDKITLLGSCFSTEIGKLMAEDGYLVGINPFGVLYNPASIASSLLRLYSGKEFTQEDVVLRDPNYGTRKHTNADVFYISNGTQAAGSEAATATNFDKTNMHRPIAPCSLGYTSFFHHGSFTRSTPEEFLAHTNASLIAARQHFLESKWIIVTFGTAWIFRHLEKNLIVSNCHKHIAAEFRREFLSVDDIVNLFRPIITKSAEDNLSSVPTKGITASITNQGIQTSEPKQWILTVSPIRHLKDGLHGNQLSKSTLLLAADQLCKEFDNVHYFPAYEIVLDELRDYKYFAADTVHPTQETVDIVWDRFNHQMLSL